MADTSATDPSDMDPISQTFAAGNALNAKHFVDQQLQYSNMLLQNAVQHQAQLNAFQSQLNAYSLQAMSRTEAVNNAIVTRSAKALLDETGDALADSIVGEQGAKVAGVTPPDTISMTNMAQQIASAIISAIQTTNLGAITPTSKT